jgi:hypothetical protein
MMTDTTKLKYRVNYNYAIYNFKTKEYESKEAIYHSYDQVRANRWKCEKCQSLFASFRELKIHKTEYHSY